MFDQLHRECRSPRQNRHVIPVAGLACPPLWLRLGGLALLLLQAAACEQSAPTEATASTQALLGDKGCEPGPADTEADAGEPEAPPESVDASTPEGGGCTEGESTSLQSYALYASHFAGLGEWARVQGGDVAVRDTHALHPQLTLAPHAWLSADHTATAHSIWLAPGSDVGALQVARLVDYGANHGDVTAFPDSLPAAPSVTEIAYGDHDVHVVGVRTLPEGDYRDVRVGVGSLLRLSGGHYRFRSLDLSEFAKLWVLAPTEIEVSDRVITGHLAKLGPAPRTDLTAKDIVISSTAHSRLLPHWHEGPAIVWGSNSRQEAVVIAPRADVLWLPFSVLHGAVVAAKAVLQHGARLIYEDGIAGTSCDNPGGPEACEPSGPCDDAQWIEGQCQHTAQSAGSSCGDEDVCNGAEVCDESGDCVSGNAPERDDGDPCTADSCDPKTGVSHTSVEGLSCGEGQSCQGGECKPSCTIGVAISATADVNLFGDVVYFENGQSLEPGRYSISYVDGCMKYSDGQWWTVNARGDGYYTWWLVGANAEDRKVILPGTEGYTPGPQPDTTDKPGFETFEECVAANQQVAPIVYDHTGGPLGIWLYDSPYSDNTVGEGGRSPSWSLTKLDTCE